MTVDTEARSSALLTTPALDDTMASVIVRLHSPDVLEDLSLCVATIALQTYEAVEVLVCCQRFDQAGLARVRAVLAATAWGSASRRCAVLNFTGETPYADCRADLLNLGLERAAGRYVAFVDYDDFLFSDFLRAGIGALRSGSAAVSVSGVVQADVEGSGLSQRVRGKREPFDTRCHWRFFVRNHHTIHSYVVDRARIGEQLAFTPGMSKHEDYWFFLQLLARHVPDRRNIRRKLSQYNVRCDGSNSIMAHSSDDHAKRRAWQRADAELAWRKDDLTVHVPYADLAELLEAGAETPHSAPRIGTTDQFTEKLLTQVAPALAAMMWKEDIPTLEGTIGSVDSIEQCHGGLNLGGWLASESSRAAVAGWQAIGLDAAGAPVAAALERPRRTVRPDVAQFLRRDATHADYGFEIEVPLAPGLHSLLLIGCLVDATLVGLRFRLPCAAAPNRVEEAALA